MSSLGLAPLKGLLFTRQGPGSTKSGILWTGAEKVLVYGINFVQGVVLARLLSPEDFGLTAMLGLFLGLGACLAESGLGVALVVCPVDAAGRMERRALQWNVALAAALYFVLALAAPAIAAWYGKPILRELMWAMAFGMVINAASVVAYARLTREQRFDRLAWVNGVSAVASALVAMAMAGWNCGVWSIVGLGLSGAALRTSLAWWFSRSRAEARGDGAASNHQPSPDTFASLLGYGWKLMLSGIVHTFYTESYNLVIGKMGSPAAVGLFARGKRWALLPGEIVNDTVGRVALPKMVNSRVERGDGWNGCGARWIGLNACMLWPCLVVLWVFAPEIVGFVLGAQWLDCVPYLRILVIGQFFTPIGNIALQKIRASGYSEVILKTDAWKKPLGFAALLCGLPYGVAGLCWAKVASDFVEAGVDMWYARKIGEIVSHGERLEHGEVRTVEVPRTPARSAGSYSPWALCSRWLNNKSKTRGKGREGGGDGPIDLVYCWYSGRVPEGQDACRFLDNGELYWSIRSVDRFASWFRRIYVFVNDDSLVPEWLTKHPKVLIVRHSEVIPHEVLPLYNAVSIEMWLHLLPGLSERFVYANDDMFLGREARPSDFFDVKGRVICRYTARSSLKELHGSTYFDQLRYARKMLGDGFQLMPHHNFDGYLKSVIEDFWRTYPEEARRSGSFRHRVGNQLQRDAFARFAVQTGRGVMRATGYHVRLHRMLGRPDYTSLMLSLSTPGIEKWIRDGRPLFFCLNDDEGVTDQDRERIGPLLERIFGMESKEKRT